MTFFKIFSEKDEIIQGKAEAVILDLLQHYKNENKEVYGFDLELFAQKALYATIDIKEDNNYLESDQCKAKDSYSIYCRG